MESNEMPILILYEPRQASRMIGWDLRSGCPRERMRIDLSSQAAKRKMVIAKVDNVVPAQALKAFEGCISRNYNEAGGFADTGCEVFPFRALEPTVPAGAADFYGHWITTWLRPLFAQRRLIFQATFCGLAVGAILAFSLPARFEATARVAPSANAVNSAGALDGGLEEFVGSAPLLIGIMESRTARDRIIERFDLKRVYGVSLMEAARAALADNTRFVESRAGIIGVTVVDKSGIRAANICSAYVDELNRILNEVTTASTIRERLFLESRLKAVKPELDSAANAAGEFSSKNIAIDIPEQTSVLISSEALLNAHLDSEKSRLEELKSNYTNRNILVRQQSSQVKKFASALRDMNGISDGSPGGHTGGGLSYPSFRTLPILTVPYSILSQRADSQAALYASLLEMIEIAKIQEARQIPNIEIIDYATVPERKYSPPRILVVIGAGILFFACSIGWTFCQPHVQRARNISRAMLAKRQPVPAEK